MYLTEKELEKIAKEKKFNPVDIGSEILRQLGYEVKISSFGYNSLYIRVFKEGNLIYEEAIGE